MQTEITHPWRSALAVAAMGAFVNTGCGIRIEDDRMPPAVDDNAFRLIRAPHGDGEDGQGLRLAITESAVPDATQIQVQSPSGVWQTVIDRPGPLEAPLLERADAPMILARAIDEAGNAGAPFPVARGRFWAGLLNYDPNDRLANPHRLALSGRASEALDLTPAGAAQAADLAQRDGTALRIDETLTWMNRADIVRAGPADGAPFQAVEDPHRGRLLVWTERQELWRWSPNEGWAQLESRLAPRRRDAAVAFDVARDRLLLFGGQGPSGPSDETWAWRDGTWSLVEPCGNPPGLHEPKMVYDRQTGDIVLHGGELASGELSDQTWLYDGECWRHGPDDGPGPRRAHAMTFDFATRSVVLIGGFASTSQDDPRRDTWRWDGERWIEMHAQGPLQGQGILAVGDRHRGVLRIFQPDSTRDAWRWTGGGWAPDPDAERPNTLFAGDTVAWVEAFGAAVMIDHRSVATLDGQGWATFPYSTEEVAIDRSTIVFAEGIGYPVAYGPAAADRAALFAWNGRDWRPLEAQNPPPFRDRPTLFADPASGDVIVFGGRDLADNRRTDGLAYRDGQWRPLWSEPGARPRPFGTWAVTGSPRTQEVLLLRQNDLQTTETWLLADGTWHRHPSTPAALNRLSAAAATSPLTGETLVVAGYDSARRAPRGDAFGFDGGEWSPRPSAAVAPQSEPGIVWDGDRGRFVLVEGVLDTTAPSARVLELIGTGWTAPAVANANDGPAADDPVKALVHDPHRHRLILAQSDADPSALWELDVARDRKPSLALSVNLTPLEVPLARITEWGIDLAGRARGACAPRLDAPEDGRFDVEVWDQISGWWVPLGAVASGTTAELRLSKISTRWLDGLGEMKLRFRPAGMSFGAHTAALEIDRLAVWIDYADEAVDQSAPLTVRGQAPPSCRPPGTAVFAPAPGEGAPDSSVSAQTLPDGHCAVLPVDSYRPGSLRHGAPLPNGLIHVGDDIPADAGTPVRAVLDGLVLTSTRTGWGTFTAVRHIAPDGRPFVALYGHLDAAPAAGDIVVTGDIISRVSTQPSDEVAPHLWFAIQQGGFRGQIKAHVTESEAAAFVDPFALLVERGECTCGHDVCTRTMAAAGALCEDNDRVVCEMQPAGCVVETARAPCPAGQECTDGACRTAPCPDISIEWTQVDAPDNLRGGDRLHIAADHEGVVHLLDGTGTRTHWTFDPDRSVDPWRQWSDIPRSISGFDHHPAAFGARLFAFRDDGGVIEWSRTRDAWSLLSPSMGAAGRIADTSRLLPFLAGARRLVLVVLARGSTNEGDILAYDPTRIPANDNPWSTLTPLPFTLEGPPMAATNGPWLVAVDGSDVWTYRADPGTAPSERWTELRGPDLTTVRSRRALTLRRGDLLISLGGAINATAGELSNRVEVFNYREDELCFVPESSFLPIPVSLARIAATDRNTLVLLGGNGTAGDNTSVFVGRMTVTPD